MRIVTEVKNFLEVTMQLMIIFRYCVFDFNQVLLT